MQIGLLSSVQAWVRAKSGTILGVERAPANSRVSWKFHPDKKAIAITVSKEAGSEDVRDYEIKVKGENSAGEIAMVALKFKVVGQAVPFALDDDGKLELKLPQSAGQQQDTQVWVKARSGVIVRVEHAPENSKVSWKHSPEKNAIAIAVSRDAGAKDARQYAVKVRGKNGTGTIEDVVLKFKVVGPVEPFALEDDGKLQLKLNPHRESQAWVKARSGTIFRVEQAPDNSRVSWKYHPDKQMIGITVPRDVSDADAREYEITVRGKDSAGREEKVVLRFRVVGPIEPFALQDDGKLEIVLNPQATKDIQVRVQCATGAIQRVVEAPAEDAKVRWNFDAESKAIVIVVARDAGIEDVKEYTIHVRGQDGAGRPKRVALKFKVTLPLR